MEQNELINVNVCLSDIPEISRRKGKNKKWYCNLVVSLRREPDQFGNTVAISVSRSKEQREAGEGIVYVGSGTIVFFDKRVSKAGTSKGNSHSNNDDLPF